MFTFRYHSHIIFVVTLALSALLLAACGAQSVATASPPPSPTASSSPTSSATATPTATPTITPTPTQSATPTITPTITKTPTITPTPTPLGYFGMDNCADLELALQVGDGTIRQLLYSTDGRWLVVAASSAVRLYSTADFNLIWEAPLAVATHEMAFSQDGESLWAVDQQGRVLAWATDDGSRIAMRPMPGDVSDVAPEMALSADGAMVAYIGWEGEVLIYYTADLSLVSVIPNAVEWFFLFPNQIAFSPDSSLIAELNFSGAVDFYRVSDGSKWMRAESEINEPLTHARRISFSPDGKDLALEFGSERGVEIHLLRLSNLKWYKTLAGAGAAFSMDGKTLAGVAPNGINLWSRVSYANISILEEDAFALNALAFSPDSAQLAGATRQGVLIWDTAKGELIHSMPGNYLSFESMSFTANGQRFAAGGWSRIELRNAADGAVVLEIPINSQFGPVSIVQISADGQIIAAALGDEIIVYNANNGEEMWSEKFDLLVADMALSPDGSMLAALPVGEPVQVRHAFTGEYLFQIEPRVTFEYFFFSHVAFSPNNQYLAASEIFGVTHVWEITGRSASEVATIHGSEDWAVVSAEVSFSADSSMLATGGFFGDLDVWQIPSGKAQKSFGSQSANIQHVAISTDGLWLVSAAYDGAVQLWDIYGSYKSCRLASLPDPARVIYLTPDGRFLWTLASDGAIRVWGVP